MLVGKKNLLSFVEYNQLNAAVKLDLKDKRAYSQYFTPASLAGFMASMFEFNYSNIRILDPGAGPGILFSAVVQEILSRKNGVKTVEVVAYEIDKRLKEYITSSMEACKVLCKEGGIEFHGEIRFEDFIEDSIKRTGFFSNDNNRFTHIITNPPYKKINTGSRLYNMLYSTHRSSPNLYTAFLSMSEALLEEGGQLVSITPRSFCNGVYFVKFRTDFLSRMRISRLHLFTSRNSAFRSDNVLQENVIIKWIKSKSARPLEKVVLSSSGGPSDEAISIREVAHSEIINPNDDEHVIWVIQDSYGKNVKERIEKLPNRLKDLGLTVSTGPVVDFRNQKYIGKAQSNDIAPLIQPECIRTSGQVQWEPSKMRKPPFIHINQNTKGLLLPNDLYVLTKRFSSNEERRRIVASIYKPISPYQFVGLENRLNYFHKSGKGVNPNLAKGLVLYLNSTMVDSYFRQMSGHTQVNASDLSRFYYPSVEDLVSIGEESFEEGLDQDRIDNIVERDIFKMNGKDRDGEFIMAKQKVTEASTILKAIGMPKEQTNEISGLTLLALAEIRPGDSWDKARDPLIGIHGMLQYFKNAYGKEYAENTRETVRRRVLHQFCQANIAIINPDDHKRPVNSGKTVYKIEPKTLELIRTFGSERWEDNLKEYLSRRKSLVEIYNGRRKDEGLQVILPDNQKYILTHGGQNVLVKAIIDLFIPQYIKDPKVLYVGDTGNKFLHYEEKTFSSLNIFLNPHGQFPDVIVLDQKRNWLCLIEAVTSHGPIDGSRRIFLEKLFEASKAPPVYITAFPNREVMKKYLPLISWHTEVWTADSPDHLIHFNGERFLGPYEKKNE